MELIQLGSGICRNKEFSLTGNKVREREGYLI
jgi:hypothetical protein